MRSTSARRSNGCGSSSIAARFDFREIEDIVDDGEERLAAVGNEFDVLALLGVELRRLEQIQEAGHAIHRRANFVAHRGEEPCLRLGTRLRGIPCRTEFLLGKFSLGNIVEDQHPGARIRITLRDGKNCAFEMRALLRNLAAWHSDIFREEFQNAVPASQDGLGISSDRASGGLAEHCRGGGIDINDAVSPIKDDERILNCSTSIARATGARSLN